MTEEGGCGDWEAWTYRFPAERKERTKAKAVEQLVTSRRGPLGCIG